ncbi:chorismate mutase [Leucobacter sp. OH1287]|uniref:chorismate mutase n=1 Tax=Leucobacter sp. OH1287 TaxID=2491049 RepID=UPI000F5F7D92|nr:chorismate mutase [Leucobacter sp. OH1287]RRD60831.1 chorismate mutase [Leucobacter sp. OH1287]
MTKETDRDAGASATPPSAQAAPAAPAAPALDPVAELARLRSSIDNIDAALVHMLAERFRCTQAVGKLKAEHAMPASDPGREKDQIARLRELAASANLDPEFAEKWFNFVVSEVIRHHRQIADAGSENADGESD